MSVNTPPTENIPIFDPSVFPSANGTALTIASGSKYFLTYPVAQGSEIFPSNVTLQSTLTDASGDVGLSGQVLSSTGTGTNWVYNTTNGYIALNLSSLPYTLPTSLSANTYIYFTGGTASGGILTIPTTGISNSTYLLIRNNSAYSFNISTSLITYTQGTILSTTSLASGSTIALFYNGTFWIQSAVSDRFNTLYSGTLYSDYVASDILTQGQSHTEINMFSDTTLGDIFLGKTLPSPYTVRICNTTAGASGGSVHCSNIGFDGSSINNATNPTGGTIKFANSQTTGPLYIGGGSTSVVRTTGPIIIGSDSTASGGINIGTGTDLTAPAVNTVNIGSSGGYATIVKGTLTSNGVLTAPSVIAPSLNASADTADMGISTTQTSGVLNIGTGPRITSFSGGAINIGTGSSAVNPINIGGTKSAITLGSAATSSVALVGDATFSKALTLPATYTTPTVSQLGYNNSTANSTAVSVGISNTTILVTGSVLPLGTFILTIYVTALFSAANSTMSLRFVEGTGVNIVGRPPNDTLVLAGSATAGNKSSLSCTFVATSTNTGNNGDITFSGLVASGTGTVAINGCKISWIKIA
jgi:hypothetical protein